MNFNSINASLSAFPHGDGRAALAIDGVNRTEELFCAHTELNHNETSWFQLFLRHPYLVTKVNVLMPTTNNIGVEVSVGSSLTRLSDYHKCVEAKQNNGWKTFVCREPWLGHYVVISSTSAARRLYLCEVQVFYGRKVSKWLMVTINNFKFKYFTDPILNIYSSVSISASSQQHLINPVWKALDGSERVNSGECYQSSYGAGAFWEVTLSELTLIHMVDVIYKPSSYKSMDGMAVYVGNKTDKTVGGMIQCGSAWTARRDNNARFYCVAPIKGKSVHITASNTTKSMLTLCEVKVYRPGISVTARLCYTDCNV